jgi:hypothetical protein
VLVDRQWFEEQRREFGFSHALGLSQAKSGLKERASLGLALLRVENDAETSSKKLLFWPFLAFLVRSKRRQKFVPLERI